MENIGIEEHSPWYARGKPLVNTRDGPPMSLSDLRLFAIRGGPSARGKPTWISCLWLTLYCIFSTHETACKARDMRGWDGNRLFLLTPAGSGTMLGLGEIQTCQRSQNQTMSKWKTNVKMELNEELVGDFETVNADRACPCLSGSVGNSDLSAFAESDNVESSVE